MNRIGKFTAVLVFSSVMFSQSAILAWANPGGQSIFSDVPTSHWAYDTIQSVANAGLWKGVAPGKFAPNRPMTRMEFATLLGRLTSQNYAQQLQGNPQASITRLELATELYKALSTNYPGVFSGVQSERSFGDLSKLTAQQQQMVKVIAGLGLMSGDSKNCFGPNNNATRAEVAVLSDRVSRWLDAYKQNGGVFYLASGVKDQLNIQIYWGQKPTTGYDIEVKNVSTTEENGRAKVYVYYQTQIPATGEIVGQVLTYPTCTVSVPMSKSQRPQIILVKADE